MNKPKDYEKTQVAGDFEPIEVGGHICVIKQVEETKSKSGLSMLVISLDTDTSDRQPKYFENQFKNDIRPDKKWGCVMYLVVDESTDYGVKNLKTFITCVENSNNGFTNQWGDNWAAQFKNKKIGAVFGREQYENQKGELKWSTKAKYFRSADKVLDVNPPEDKYLNKQSNNVGADGFMNIQDGIDEELPFN